MPSAPSERGPIMHGKMLFLTRRIEWVGSRQRAYNNVDKMGGAGLQVPQAGLAHRVPQLTGDPTFHESFS